MAHLRNVDLNLLVVLGALLVHEGVGRAAAAANMSQPAVSRALSRLRHLLQDPLLVRSGGRTVLTPKACAMRPEVERLLATVSDLVAPDSFAPEAWNGELKLAATDHQTIMLLPRLMARLADAAPRLRVRVIPFSPATTAALQRGEIDLAFGVVDALPSGLRREALYEDRFVTLIRAGHPALPTWSLADFLALSHVLISVLDDAPSASDLVLARSGLKRRIVLRLPHFFAAMAVVAETDFVVTIPRTLADRHAGAFGLVALDPPLDLAPFTLSQVWPAALDADPANRWVRSVVGQCL